ncbi:ABC transporter substrate-binding protein [Candidatus Gottesmanbacteria bacterium]|nr:ABC transporter substrate-binding protein [Candidatus Gottesmanbacteria bacterium]
MRLFRRGRFFYWLARELSYKYTLWLTFGFIVGLAASIAFGRFLPLIVATWFSPIDRIGVIGEFTPSTLPLPIQQEISMGLTRIDPDGTPKPALASSWQVSEDGKTYFLGLRNDLVWHNGKPVEATGVNYNIKNVMFQVDGPHRLKVTLEEPYSPFLTILAKPIIQSGLGGLGPYKVVSIRLNGDKIQYLKLLPVSGSHLRPKEYRFYRTEAQAITAYKIGDVDILDDVSTPNELATWRNTQITRGTRSGRIVALFFNLRKEGDIVKEKPIRQALGYGLPEFSEERAYSPIAATSWAYNDNVRRFTHDISTAKRLLANAQIATSSAITITTFSQYVDTAQKIADSWNAIGVKTTVKVENAVNGSWQVLLSAQDIPPDPDQYPFWHSTQTATNITGYSNLKVDKLLEDGRKEFDREKREKIYADFQRFLVEDAPALFLYYAPSFTIKRG